MVLARCHCFPWTSWIISSRDLPLNAAKRVCLFPTKNVELFLKPSAGFLVQRQIDRCGQWSGETRSLFLSLSAHLSLNERKNIFFMAHREQSTTGASSPFSWLLPQRWVMAITMAMTEVCINKVQSMKRISNPLRRKKIINENVSGGRNVPSLKLQRRRCVSSAGCWFGSSPPPSDAPTSSEFFSS